MSSATKVSGDKLAAICRRWRIAELALFGSVAEGTAGADSDIDLLVDFEPDAAWTLFGLVESRDELSALFARPVDLVTRRGLENSRNWIRRDAILFSARTLYAA